MVICFLDPVTATLKQSDTDSLWVARLGSPEIFVHRRCVMRRRLLALLGGVAVIAVVSLVSVAAQTPTTAAKPAKPGPAPKTSLGAPDLQGLWTSELQIPLQRPAKYAGREFLTDAEVAELDKVRATLS